MNRYHNKAKLVTCLLATISVLAFTACSDTPTTGVGAGTGVGLTDANKPQKPVFVNINHKDVCFIKTGGANNFDTTKVHLRVEGERVTGTMKEMIFEKDARIGTLEGAMIGDAIDVVWNYMQEGKNDTMALDFQYSLDTLRQRPYTIDIATGRQITDINSAYSVKLIRVECLNGE